MSSVPRDTSAPAPARRKPASSKPAPAPARKQAAASQGLPTRPLERRRSPEEVQARILAAATHEFSEHGFAGARIERISKQARTVDRMLYYYFGNKERLYQAVFERAFAQMIAAERDFQVPQDDPALGMAMLIEHTWEHYIAHPELVRLLMNENLMRGRQVRKSGVVREVSLPLIERVEELLVLGRRAGVFREGPSAAWVLMSIMSMGFFYVSNQYTISEWLRMELMEPERRASWLAHVKDTILSSLRPVSALSARAETAKASRRRSPIRKA